MSSDPFRPNNYSAYLVRLWQETPQTAWRASAQSAITGQKHYFATLAELFVFLEEQTSNAPVIPAKLIDNT